MIEENKKNDNKNFALDASIARWKYRITSKKKHVREKDQKNIAHVSANLAIHTQINAMAYTHTHCDVGTNKKEFAGEISLLA